MLRLLIYLVVPLFLFSSDKGIRLYKNHVYFFTINLPAERNKLFVVVEPPP